ncbi:MAG: DUF1501 domain-containing protein [Acidobacteria bacterium]|nr:DUF1501 domain-containing protein [Acidobacteriota bacterium]
MNPARRHFLEQCGVGLGRAALASLLAADGRLSGAQTSPRQPHFPPRARSIIYLFMEGGPSQLDLFQHKPKLKAMDGQPTPASLLAGKKFAFMERMNAPKLLATPREFRQHGQSGHTFSNLLPRLATVADDLSFIHTMKTPNVNHSPAMIMAHTGAMVAGRPSLGAWLLYGLGSETQDLPAFIAMTSGPRGPRNGNDIWGSGFLPTQYQGVPFLNAPSPIYYLDNPGGVTADRQRRAVAALGDLNRERLQTTGDREIEARIASYEMAFRMQSSAPDLMDLTRERPETLALYGATPGKPGFATNCLLARRLVERGVRCVQVYHTDWDHHNNINASLDRICPDVDRASAALILDLKQRGLLDQTLVVWGGEFGRTPMTEGDGKNPGRNHLVEGYSTWVAGGGIKPGVAIGQTDELGFGIAENPVPVHDLHATLLHQFGFDHKRLTHRSQGRDFRLTDVHGEVLRQLT